MRRLGDLLLKRGTAACRFKQTLIQEQLNSDRMFYLRRPLVSLRQNAVTYEAYLASRSYFSRQGCRLLRPPSQALPAQN